MSSADLTSGDAPSSPPPEAVPASASPQRGRERRGGAVPAWLWAPIGALLVLLAGASTYWVATGHRTTAQLERGQAGPASAADGLPTLSKGTAAPPFTLANLSPGGPPVRLAAGVGHPVLVNFFASWCPGCRAELKAFAATERAEGAKLTILGVDVNDTSASAARSMLAEAGDRYQVGVAAATAPVVRQYQVVDLPTTVVLDGHGRVVTELFGTQTQASLTRAIRRAGA